jgi:deoxyinosine 3'endonuclease (endonuclease V)
MVYVSTGHRVSLDTAVRITRRLCKSRIPEPLRRADLESKKVKRKERKSA